MRPRPVASVVFFMALSVSIPSLASAQFVGMFRWQLTPFCNVVTVAVTQSGGTFTLDGFDDQCGGATRAAVVGTAFPNPNGSIGVGLSIIATPGAAPVHVDVALSLATIGGPWRDSAGNTGMFQFNPPEPAPGTPRPATGGLISTITPGAGLVGGGTTGPVSLAVVYGGSGSAQTAARSDHTHAAPGTNNTAVGVAALSANVGGVDNTAMGARALDSVSTGNLNSALGAHALGSLTTGQENTAVGASALFVATGSFNTAVGTLALTGATGSRNVAVGREAFGHLLAGDDNIAIGHLAGDTLTTGSGNIYIGGNGLASENGTIRIGNASHESTLIEGIHGKSVSASTDAAVLVDVTGKLGTVASSARFKEDIHPLDDLSRAILRLEPVTFRYKPEQQRGNALQYGLIAEQVAEVLPELVINDHEGRPLTVKYHLLPTLLLAEIQRLERERAAQALALEELREEVQRLRNERR